jgi:hypothetical protein
MIVRATKSDLDRLGRYRDVRLDRYKKDLGRLARYRNRFRAAIGFDNSAFRESATNVSSDTFSFTVGSGTNRVLLVAVCYGATSVTISSVKYATVTMNNIRTDTVAGVSTLGLYQLVAPTSGANNIVVTLSGALAGGRTITSLVFAATGVDQTSPIDANNSGTTATSATAWSLALVTGVDNAWLFDAWYTGSLGGGGTIGVGASQTLIGSTVAGGGGATFGRASYYGPSTPAGSKTMSYTLTSESTGQTTLESSCSLTPVSADTVSEVLAYQLS